MSGEQHSLIQDLALRRVQYQAATPLGRWITSPVAVRREYSCNAVAEAPGPGPARCESLRRTTTQTHILYRTGLQAPQRPKVLGFGQRAKVFDCALRRYLQLPFS